MPVSIMSRPFREMWKKLDFYARVLGDWTW